ncbi:transposase [Paenibacillus sp.]
MDRKEQDMLPLSHEKVEVDGVYINEAGREEHLHRGQHFPADPVLGKSEWKLTEYAFDNHHEGRTDERLVPKEDDTDKKDKIDSPRRQFQGG